MGLGPNCLTKLQIGRHLINKFVGPVQDLLKAKDVFQSHKELGGAHVFDWVFIHDYNKLLNILDGNLENIFKKENLSPGNSSRKYCLDKEHDIGWNHLFSRDKGIMTSEIIEEEFLDRKEKIHYLTEKFKTLYVLSESDVVYAPKNLDKNYLKKLSETLKRLRNNDNFSILYISHTTPTEAEDNIFIMNIRKRKFEHQNWNEYNHDWDKCLNCFSYAVEESNENDTTDKDENICVS